MNWTTYSEKTTDDAELGEMCQLGSYNRYDVFKDSLGKWVVAHNDFTLKSGLESKQAAKSFANMHRIENA